MKPAVIFVFAASAVATASVTLALLGLRAERQAERDRDVARETRDALRGEAASLAHKVEEAERRAKAAERDTLELLSAVKSLRAQPLPLLSAALGGASLQSMLVLGTASGLGAGIGAVLSYKVADALVARTPALPEGRVFRWVARNVDTRPRASRFMIFLIATSPLPDGTVVVPLAVVGYGLRRLAAPLFLGKLVHNLLLALLFSWVGSWAAEHVSKKASTDLAVAVAVLFMLLVGYHAEKARNKARAGREDAPLTGEDRPA